FGLVEIFDVLLEPRVVTELPAVGRVDDHESGATAVRDVGRSFDLLERIGRENLPGEQKERGMDRSDVDAEVFRERVERFGILRRLFTRDHHFGAGEARTGERLK